MAKRSMHSLPLESAKKRHDVSAQREDLPRFDFARGVAWLGPCSIAIQRVEPGTYSADTAPLPFVSYQIGGAEGARLRPLALEEILALRESALLSEDPIESLASAVLEASKVREGAGEPVVLQLIVLLLSGRSLPSAGEGDGGWKRFIIVTDPMDEIRSMRNAILSELFAEPESIPSLAQPRTVGEPGDKQQGQSSESVAVRSGGALRPAHREGSIIRRVPAARTRRWKLRIPAPHDAAPQTERKQAAPSPSNTTARLRPWKLRPPQSNSSPPNRPQSKVQGVPTHSKLEITPQQAEAPLQLEPDRNSHSEPVARAAAPARAPRDPRQENSAFGEPWRAADILKSSLRSRLELTGESTELSGKSSPASGHFLLFREQSTPRQEIPSRTRTASPAAWHGTSAREVELPASIRDLQSSGESFPWNEFMDRAAEALQDEADLRGIDR